MSVLFGPILVGGGVLFATMEPSGAVGSAVTAVTVAPASITLVGGASLSFTATVSGTLSPSQAVTWTSTAGAIDDSGGLIAAPATSTDQVRTVTATSVQDPSKSGSATVTISATVVVPDPDPDTGDEPTLPDPTPPVSAAARDYTWLKQAVANWSHRGDLGPMMDDFVMLAEKRIDGDLEARLQNAMVTIPTIANVSAVLVPSDVADVRSLSIPLYGPIGYVTPDQFNAEDETQAAGVPRYFTTIGPYLYLTPTPDAIYQMRCAYRQLIPSLLDEADGQNWLIRDCPSIYLAAVMVEVIAYTKNFPELDLWEGKYKIAVDSLDKNNLHGTASLRVRSDVRH